MYLIYSLAKDRSVSQREERISPLFHANLSGTLNLFFPRASDESAKSAYRADRNNHARSWTGLVRLLERFLPSHGCVSRDARTAMLLRTAMYACFGSVFGQLLVLRIHERGRRKKRERRSATAGNYRSSVLTLKRPTVGDGMHLPWVGMTGGDGGARGSCI